MDICPVCGNETFVYSFDPDTWENVVICTCCGEDFLDSDDYEEDGNAC